MILHITTFGCIKLPLKKCVWFRVQSRSNLLTLKIADSHWEDMPTWAKLLRLGPCQMRFSQPRAKLPQQAERPSFAVRYVPWLQCKHHAWTRHAWFTGPDLALAVRPWLSVQVVMLEGGKMKLQIETLGLFLWKRKVRGPKYLCFFRVVLSVL